MSTNDPLAADRQKKSVAGKATYIAVDCLLEGDFRFSGPVTIAGNIRGNVICDDQILIERGAIIDGNVRATIAIIHGRISGDLVAERSVEIWTKSSVSGRIFSRSIRVDEGAELTAQLSISADLPLPDTQPVQNPAQPPMAQHGAQAGSTQAPVTPPSGHPDQGAPLPGAGYRRKFAHGNDH